MTGGIAIKVAGVGVGTLPGLQGVGHRLQCKAEGQETLSVTQLGSPAICVCVWLYAGICRQTAYQVTTMVGGKLCGVTSLLLLLLMYY